MKPQPFKRKIRIFLHCLFRFHRRGIYRWRRANELLPHYSWVCATCAPRHVRFRSDLTPQDIEWAEQLVAQHPEWNDRANSARADV